MSDNLPAKIVETPLYPVMIRAYCKKCGTELIRDRWTLLSSPPQYQYRCEKCNIDFVSREEFPRIAYKTQDESEDNDNE